MILPIFPEAVQVEPTNICNLNCTFCPRRNMKYRQGYMEWTIFQKIIDEIVEKRLVVNTLVKFYFMGEPLMHPHLAMWISYAKRHNVPIGIMTNGTLLDKVNLNLLIRNATEIGVSLDGFNAETYEQLRLNSNYAKVVENIKYLCQLKREQNSFCNIRLTSLMPDDDAQASIWLTSILKQWEHYDVKIAPLERHPHANTVWLGKPDGIQPEIKRLSPCLDGLNSLVVRWDGEVTFCCGDINTHASLGNVKDKSLQEIWVSPEMWRIRNSILKLKFDKVAPCRNCTVINKLRTFTVPKILGHKLA